MKTRRIRLTLQFDGGPFHGWQLQENAPSVQGAVESALAALLGAPHRVHSAGRTDTGVHAAAMPVHFDTALPIPVERLPVALMKFLPDAISVLDAREAAAGFDARRDARLRWYRYQVLLSGARRPLGPRAWVVHRPVDCEAVARGLALLEGEHDFAGFRSSQCQSVRTLLTMRQAALTRAAVPGGLLLALDFKCRSFLHHQVRFMTGSVIALGTGVLTEERLLRIRDQHDRPQLAQCAPPEGLCLMAVGYDEAECAALLAARPAPPSF